MLCGMRLAMIAALAATALAASTSRLEYQGISAATTLADLQARFPGRVELGGDDPANSKHPVTASIRFEPWLGRSHYLDYYEIANEQRIIRLFFIEPGTRHPENDTPLRCSALLSELEARYGKAPKTDEFSEEALHHVKHIWTQGNETMSLDCAHLAHEPLTVDRLFFECRGACR
jgi:hypothetical protein